MMWKGVVKVVLSVVALVVVGVPLSIVGLVRFKLKDHSDVFAWSCAESPGAQCANGVCPDEPAYDYEGEYAQTMDWYEKVVRGMGWKPDYAAGIRYAYQRYQHFLENQDLYTFTNTDFYPMLWGVDLDGQDDWDLPAYLSSNFSDRISFVNSLAHDVPPPSIFPKWFYHWMIGTMFFDRVPSAKDPYAGKYVNNREVGFRFFAQAPLCNLQDQLREIQLATSCAEREARSLRLAVHALSDSANDIALDILLPLCSSSVCFSEEEENCKVSQTKRAKFLRRLIQVAFLRKGEVVNCQKQHTSESCIFPLSEKAQHVDKEPALELMEWLRLDDDQHSKWLQNIAAMQLGLPQLIDINTLPNQVEIPRFKNIAGPLGLDTWGGTGAIAGDVFFNDVGAIDFYVQIALQWPRGKKSASMFKNLQNGSFEDVSLSTKLAQGAGGNIGKPADFDNDGDLDIFNGRGGWMPMLQLPNSLYQNNDGVFEEVTRKVGDLTGEKGTHSAAWADFDLDGDLDLFVASEQNPCELFLNDNQGRFTEVAAQFGVADCGWVKGVAWGDLNGDKYPDLVVSCISGKNQVYINKVTHFEDIAEQVNATGPRFSQPVAVVDIDNDGDLDIVYGAHRPPDPSELYALYTQEPWEEQYIMDRRGLRASSGRSQVLLNNGDATFFEDVSERTDPRLLTCGVMAMNYGDINNDGYPDFYMGTGWPDLRGLMPNLMLLNMKDGTFKDATFTGGFGHLQKGHGISFIDIQNDGHLDVAASMGGAMPGDLFFDALYLNPGNQNNWIKISLKGIKSNSFGQGASLVLKLKDGTTLYSVVGQTASFGSNPIRIHHVGLGTSTLTSLLIQWPHIDVPDQLLTFGQNDPTHNAWIEITESSPHLVHRKDLATFDLDADQLIQDHEQHGACHHHSMM